MREIVQELVNFLTCIFFFYLFYILIIILHIIVTFQESMVTEECIIPQKHHRTVMGAKGRKVQMITSEYDVQIKFPDRDTYG